MKSEYISNANQIYMNLQEVESLFEKEAYILSYVKCMLLKNEDLNDFNINGINVAVYETSNGYELLFDENIIDLEIYGNQIINYEIRR